MMPRMHPQKRTGKPCMLSFRHTLDNPGDSTDHQYDRLSEEELSVTATGQVSTAMNGESVFSLNKKIAEQKMQALEKKEKICQVISGKCWSMPKNCRVTNGQGQTMNQFSPDGSSDQVM